MVNWIDSVELEQRNEQGNYVKPVGDSEYALSMIDEPVKRTVTRLDPKTGVEVSNLYWDVKLVDGRVLGCTNYLFGTIRKELEQLKGKDVITAVVRVKKVQGDKVSWVVMLKSFE